MNNPSRVEGELPETEFSRISSGYLAKLVEMEYNLPGPICCRLLNPEGEIYEVSSADSKAILRVHEFLLLGLPVAPHVEFQYELATFLRQAGLPASYPIPRRNGELFGFLETAEGERCFGLWSYAYGDAKLTVERVCVLGKTLAEIHLATDSFQTVSDPLRFNLETLLHVPQQRLEQFFTNSRHEDMEFLRCICKGLENQLKHDLPKLPSFSFGPIWGDSNGSNQHFVQNERITIFDYEFSGCGWRIYDLATFRWALDREMRDSNGFWQAIVEGYESVRGLTKDEMRLIPHFVLLRHLWVMGPTVAEHANCPELAPIFLTIRARWDRAFCILREIAARVDIK